MTADSHDSDDAASYADDVFDEEFVIEDFADEREEDEATRCPQLGDKTGAAEELLFTAGSDLGALGSAAPEICEEAASDASSGDLVLDGALDAAVSGEDEAALRAAAETVADELGSLIDEGEDFGLDSEVDLELVRGDEGFETPAAFVLDDGEQLCAADELEPGAAAATDAGAGSDGVGTDSERFALSASEGPLDAVADEDESTDLGLFGGMTHELPPVDEDPLASGVADSEPEAAAAAPPFSLPGAPEAATERDAASSSEATYDTSGYETDDVYQDAFAEEPGAPAPQAGDGDAEPSEEPAAFDVSEVAGHDIYGDEADEPDAVVIGGPGSARRRWGGALAAAASLALVGLSATAWIWPAWFGLQSQAERVERVALARPVVSVAVTEPVKLSAPAATTATSVQGADQGAALAAAGGDASETRAPAADGDVAPATAPSQQLPQRGSADEDRAASTTALAGAAPLPNPDAWPAAPAVETEPRSGALARFGDDLLVGGAAASSRGASAALAAVAPGHRAFAQLHNGNYFVGRVKRVAEAAITLRVATGEVTLPRDDVAQFTRLGSSEYEELQRATQGSVRLTNNQRLVGGILTRIADDHVVLELRSNRVMLPREAIGEIVSGGDERDVRLGTTSEEDSWLRGIAERELGTERGLGAPAGRERAPDEK